MNTTLDLSAYPRYRLMGGATPIQHLPRLSQRVGADIYLKRDDVNGIAAGGNKLRKLEFLIGAALAEGADTIITLGARQSNHARLTAAAAARAGLRCELVLTRSVPRFDAAYTDNGNILLDELLGAQIHDLPAGANGAEFAEARRAELAAQGHSAYIAPVGGSSPLGCLGYAVCADEIMAQSREMGVQFDRIALANGSGGTHAGLVAGLVALGAAPSVLGFTIAAPLEVAHANTLDKANQTIKLIHPALSVTDADIAIDSTQIGDGYGIPTDAMRAAVRLMATTEGILLDPVYSGKAFAGLLQHIADDRIRAGQKLLFIMTGGLPGLFAYRDAF